jgi:predicted ribosome quality control (RQC) complex YloA/Tae2 family protein
MSLPQDVPSPERERAIAIVKALRRHRQRLARKAEAIRGDLEEARRGPLYRRYAEALLVHLRDIPARAAHAKLPDPADPGRTLEFEIDPAVRPQVNAARYFKRAAKAERGMDEIPARLRDVEASLAQVTETISRAEPALESEPIPAEIVTELEHALDRLPPQARRETGLPSRRGSKATAGGAQTAAPAAPAKRTPELPARLRPRRLKTREGWDVLIGRTNEGNDHLTLHMARPEDYWFHVHGSPGSHVVLRRGKSKDEPSKATLREVASWTAFFSQSRTAGTVPVIWTLKKYVRKPRKAPAGTVVCEREKTIMVKPQEPPREAMPQDEA